MIIGHLFISPTRELSAPESLPMDFSENPLSRAPLVYRCPVAGHGWGNAYRKGKVSIHSSTRPPETI